MSTAVWILVARYTMTASCSSLSPNNAMYMYVAQHGGGIKVNTSCDQAHSTTFPSRPRRCDPSRDQTPPEGNFRGCLNPGSDPISNVSSSAASALPLTTTGSEPYDFFKPLFKKPLFQPVDCEPVDSSRKARIAYFLFSSRRVSTSISQSSGPQVSNITFALPFWERYGSKVFVIR